MKRFIDLRGQDTGYRFAWWDTIVNEFESWATDRAWNTWADFAESAAIACGGADRVDADDLDRYRRLCPAWVFEESGEIFSVEFGGEHEQPGDRESRILRGRLSLMVPVDPQPPPWVVLSTETPGAEFPPDTKVHASHHGWAFEAVSEEGGVWAGVPVRETEMDRGEAGSLKELLLRLRRERDEAVEDAACLRAEGKEPCAAAVKAQGELEISRSVTGRLVEQLKEARAELRRATEAGAPSTADLVVREVVQEMQVACTEWDGGWDMMPMEKSVIEGWKRRLGDAVERGEYAGPREQVLEGPSPSEPCIVPTCVACGKPYHVPASTFPAPGETKEYPCPACGVATWTAVLVGGGVVFTPQEVKSGLTVVEFEPPTVLQNCLSCGTQVIDDKPCPKCKAIADHVTGDDGLRERLLFREQEPLRPIDPIPVDATIPMVGERGPAPPALNWDGTLMPEGVPLPCGACGESPEWTSHGWLCPTEGCKGAEVPDHVRGGDEWDGLWMEPVNGAERAPEADTDELQAFRRRSFKHGPPDEGDDS
jgi:hypothetical protein